MTSTRQLHGLSPQLPAAPSHLSDRAKKLWRETVSEYVLEPHHLALLRLALEAVDRAEMARAAIAKEGAFTTNRYGSRVPHPAVAIERDAGLRAARMFRELDLEPPKDTRVPRRR